jgi:uncharacterized protein
LSHLGHRATWTTVGDTSAAQIAGGPGRVVVSDGMLTLIVEASDAETLTRVQHILSSHLERLAQRQELQVTWAIDVDGAASSTPSAPTDHRRPTRPPR